MAGSSTLLDDVRIASPCSMSWDRMQGDDRVRFCGECRRNVYNLSGLDRAGAEALLRSHAERGEPICGRLYRRPDGTVLTADCPVGLRAARQRAARAAYRIVAAVALLAGGAALLAMGQRRETTSTPLRLLEPFKTVCRTISNRPAPAPPMIMGEIALPVMNNGTCGTTPGQEACPDS